MREMVLTARRGALVCALLLIGCRAENEGPTSLTTLAATVPSGFSDTVVAGGLGNPTALAFTPDGRMLITTQSGALRVSTNGVLQPGAALDLSARLCTNSERGLLGVALDPAFASTRHLFLFYTFKKHGVCTTNASNEPVNRVSRFTLGDDNRVDPASELVLVDNIPSPAGNHNGGDLQFGADQLLYISVGDGGCHPDDSSRCAGTNNIARSLSTLLGKILRITKTGAIPADNPYAAATGARRCGDPAGVPSGTGPCRETFSSGLRNPFRIAFRPGTNDFYINDVGQNVWEEINVGARRADYGWNVREGFCANGSSTNCGAPPAGLTNPLFAYKHGSNTSGSPFQGCNSITGGAFAPTGAWPAPFDGAYFFADYVCQKIFRLAPNGSGGVTATSFASSAGAVVHMRFGPTSTGQGLYYTTYSNGGEVRRIVSTAATNRPPTAVLDASVTSGAAPLTVSFDAGGSSDPDGQALTYLWTFGDGRSAQTTASSIDHVYTSAGTYVATVVVRDTAGASSSPASVTITMSGNQPPSPTITAPASAHLFRVGETITLQGTASDAEDGTLPDTSLRWTVLLHHNGDHTHPFLAPTTGNGLTFTAPAPEDLMATGNGSFLEIRLTATDSAGASSTVVQRLDPNRVAISLVTDPPGLSLQVNGVSFTAPTTLTSWEGYALNVAAPNQTVGGVTYTFASWSDGGGASHAVVTPPAATELAARFTGTVAFTAKINFQPTGAATPAGYLADTGSVFGARGNGVSFGWNATNAEQTRERNASNAPDQRYDTLTHLQKPANPNASWELQLPNGTYRVRLVAGDPLHWDSVYQLALEGTLALSGTPSSTTRWFDTTTTVMVSDGRLTLTNGAGASNNKINFLEVAPAP